MIAFTVSCWLEVKVYNMEKFQLALDALCETLGSLEGPDHQRSVKDMHVQMRALAGLRHNKLIICFLIVGLWTGCNQRISSLPPGGSH